MLIIYFYFFIIIFISFFFLVLHAKFYHKNSEPDEVRRFICITRRTNNIVPGKEMTLVISSILSKDHSIQLNGNKTLQLYLLTD